MASSYTPAGWQEPRKIPWRVIFRTVRWVMYAGGIFTIFLILQKSPPPPVVTNPQAAASAEKKVEQVQQAVSNGQPATLRMNEAELNSYLATHLNMGVNAKAGTVPTAAADAAQANPAPAAAAGEAAPGGAVPAGSASPAVAGGDLPAAPAGTPAEQIEQVRSSVKDVKVELIEDRARAYVVFDFHGKDLTLQLEGKLGAQDGYLHFDPVAGQIGSLPIPQSSLEAAVRRLMESPENREKLKLPAQLSDLKIENGEVVATYK
jgi:hypothetical protein